MKIAALLREATDQLKVVNQARAPLEARLILAHVLGCRPEEVVNRDLEELAFKQEKTVRAFVERRQKYEPLAYILGEKEFFGLPFEVSRDVLIPRPETEALLEEILRWIQSRNLTKGSTIDLGTGTGCLAISLARHLPQAFEIFGMDISPKALEVAKRNAARHQTSEIHWLKADMRDDPFGSWTLIVSNPPYIPAGEIEDLQPDIRYYEPRIALDGGKDGLDYLASILTTWAPTLAVPGLMALETHGRQQIEYLRTLVNEMKKGRSWSIGPHFFFEAD